MEIVVQKFGGSSVKNKSMRQQVINHVINAKNQDKTPVVVVSAIGKQSEPYSTDKLIELKVFHQKEKLIHLEEEEAIRLLRRLEFI